MKIYILTTNSELESAQRLGYETSTVARNYAHHFDNYVMVRWGNSSWAYSRDGKRNIDYKNVINRAKFIKQNVEKHKSIKLLAQVVNVPTIYEKNIPKEVLAVVRPLQHASGSDFSVQKGPFKIQSETYGTRFIKTEDEYRVWFIGENTMCAKRVKMERNGPVGDYACRSNWGYKFADNVPIDLHYQTLMAAKKIGLDCGAADVLFHKNKWYFLELNSAASVDHRKIREFFQKGIETFVKVKFPEDTTIPVVTINTATTEKKKRSHYSK